jgi:hypothetical protein
MFQKHKVLMASGGALALALSASLALADDTSTSPNPSDAKVNTEPGSQGKTSDRTPGEAAPDRTPNASTSGNTGTDAGQTTEGTSDRTPKEEDQK